MGSFTILRYWCRWGVRYAWNALHDSLKAATLVEEQKFKFVNSMEQYGFHIIYIYISGQLTAEKLLIDMVTNEVMV